MPAISLSNVRSATGRFVPGVSGNPAGRPKGSRNTSTLLIEALREGQAEEILETAVAKAKAGDGPMLRCLVAHLFPKPRHPGVELDVPEGREHDPRAVVESALRGLARGEITPEEAFLIARTLEKAAKLMARPAAASGKAPAKEPAPVDRLYSRAAGAPAPATREPAPRAQAVRPTPAPEPVAPEKSLYPRRREIRRGAAGDVLSPSLREAEAKASAASGRAGQGRGGMGAAPADRLYSRGEPQPGERPRAAA
jgi:hypothetical protein